MICVVNVSTSTRVNLGLLSDNCVTGMSKKAQKGLSAKQEQVVKGSKRKMINKYDWLENWWRAVDC